MYNESIKDLFVEPGRSSASVNKHDIRLDKRGKVYVEGLVECEVSAEWTIVRTSINSLIVFVVSASEMIMVTDVEQTRL